MAQQTAQRQSGTKAVMVCVVGIVLFSATVSAWFSDQELAGLIWPRDITERVVLLLGGSVQRSPMGHAVAALGMAAVAVRIAVTTLLLTAAVTFLRRHIAKDTSATDAIFRALRQTGLVLVGSSSWWLLWLAGDLAVSPLQNFAVGCLPLWITMTIGLPVWIWWEAAIPPRQSSVSTARRQHLTPLAVLSLCVVGWIAVSFWMNACLYQYVMIPHGDSAMYEEHLWNHDVLIQAGVHPE